MSAARAANLAFGAWCVTAGLVAGGCEPRTLCLNCLDGASWIDAGAGDEGSDGGGGEADLSGLGDGAGGPDMAPCDPSRLAIDPNHCGACGNACPRAHAVPSCVAGQCGILQCDVGWIDLDGLLANDCEYGCLITGTEACDGQDNDCNGLVDELFDKQTDPLNCGGCGTSCGYANGVASCILGVCELVDCLAGYRDLDPLADGCEYHCPEFPPLAFEICNGLDDDCDGDVDEAADLETPPVGLCVTTPATPCAGTLPACETRGGVTTWYCGYGAGVEFDPSLPNGIAAEESACDGADGDCDGAADDPFADLDAICDNGLLGACRDQGRIVCDPADDTKTRCDLTVAPDPVPGAPLAEQCNNVDDDCDGSTDEIVGPNRLIEDMVHVVGAGLDFYIDRYEASRPDSSGASPGVLGTRSCSKAGVLPWTQVPYAVAQAACAAGGLRLCTAAEWQLACASVTPRIYPYGDVYEGAACNGVDFAAPASLLPTGAAALSMCVSVDGVHDLSGNAKEWTNDQQGTTTGPPPQPIYVVRGGAYASPSLGLTCATTFSQASADTSLADLGFRCCASTAP